MIRVVVRDFVQKAGVGVWIMEQKEGRNYCAKPSPWVFTEVGNGDGCFALPEPTLELSYDYSREFFQGLVNELAALGYRPNTDRLAGQLEAQTTHLKREQEGHDRIFRLLEQVMRG